MLIHRNARLWFAAGALLLGAALAAPQAAVAQDGCEVPLFVKQNSGGANVMVMADNSGSMNAAIYHFAYDRSISWPGSFDHDRTYYVGHDGWYEPNDFNWRWVNSPSLYLVDSDNGQDGRYSGNYLNWLFYNANDIERVLTPSITRIQILKAILDQILERSARLNFGLTIFNHNEGGRVVGGCGTDIGVLRAAIAGITANTWTPIGETLETILDYFADRGNFPSPIQATCDYNFILMVTDGLPTMDRDVSFYLHDTDGDGNEPGSCASIGAPYSEANDCSDYMDDVAYYMANSDVAPHVDGDQHAYTYVVGYNENGDLLKETAINGQGLFFEAGNAVELFLSIEYALQDILRRISAGSAVAVVSTERGTDDRLYRGKFMPIDWNGYLESYLLPYDENDQAVWEAGNLLKSRNPNSRNIFTALGDDMMEFVPGNATNLMVKMEAMDETEAAKLIAWGQGNYVNGYRYRQQWVLGDIIHSTPVVVGPPSEFRMEESYTAFREAHKNRRKMVYVGANDGMIHGFDAESGHENWAFVPEFALPKFSVMADSFYCHTYTCDQTATVKDIQVNGAWRTVMVGGGGEGGASLFALDITYPDYPAVLWQSDLPNKKVNHSEVEVVSIGGTSMALVGSGLHITNKRKAFLYAFDMETGTELGRVRLSKDSGAIRNKATRPVVVDLNLDGETDVVYMADLFGDLWRFQTNGNIDPSNWDMTKLYDGSQEIQADPVAAFGPNGSVYIYFGTGVYLEDPDMTSTGQNSFICVYDHHDGSTVSMGDLANQTSSVGEIGGSMGWYVNLWNAEGERVTNQAVVVAETVIFTSFEPSSDPCVAGGHSWAYQLSYQDGGIPDSEDMEDEDDRSVSIGEGIASYPVVDLSEGSVVVQSSDASITVVPIAGIIERMRVRSWQENFDHVQQPADETVILD